VSRRRTHHGEEHRDVSGGTQRAAVFGISDGLVTNVSLILGFAGANPAAGVVRLAGIAGLVAGAFSMASGEFLSMRAQQELFERELDIERNALREEPDLERQELIGIYRSKGIDEGLASELADAMMRSPELALETHAREELGIDPTAVGSPIKASATSFGTFALGAFFPLIPWLIGSGTGAVFASIAIAALVAVIVGGLLGRLAGRSPVRSAVRQLVVTALAAGVTFGVGRAVGIGTSG
jgi:VIT1/CCC1 family predicted Fe2+/Mn2+ transporter